MLEPGDVIGGRYRIRRVLGRGGMGIVYEAEHTSLGRTVAVKALLGDREYDPEHVLRFLREARAAAAIGHPGIVDVFDLSQPGEAPFLAMEKLEGEELRARIARGPLAIDDVQRIGIELASAIGAAHEHGIVHRDLKPDNVFLARSGAGERVKVLDFGIAKLVKSGDDQNRLTKAGWVYGTPAYMAPEQMQGIEVDARADVYALGAILFEALTGAPPFQGESIHELLLKVATQPAPSVASLRPEAPPALVELVAMCLAKARDERPASAAEVGRRLGSIHAADVARTATLGVATPPVAAHVERKTSTGRKIAYALVVLVVAVAGLVAGVFVVGTLDDERRESERLERVEHFVAHDRALLLAALVARMNHNSARDAAASAQLYDDLKLYLLLTVPRERREPLLDEDFAAEMFAQEHVADSELSTPEVRASFDGYMSAMGAQFVDLPSDAFAPRDGAVVASARTALLRFTMDERALASLWAHVDPYLSEPVGANIEGLAPLEPVPYLYTHSAYVPLREAFDDVSTLRLERWVVPSEEIYMHSSDARAAYAEAYAAAWLARLLSARWGLPEARSPAALRQLLTVVASEPANPAERLAAEVVAAVDLGPVMTEPLEAPDRINFFGTPAERENEMANTLRARFAPLALAIAPQSGRSVFARYRAEIQRLLETLVALGDAPPDGTHATIVREVQARVRVLIDAQSSELRPFFEAVFWPPVVVAGEVLGAPS